MKNYSINKDLISVILSTFNDEMYIKDAVNSVMNQTYRNIELIIFNDASTDNTERIIKPFLKNKKIRYISNQTNQGLVNNLNRGMRIARGKWIARIDGDDIWHDPNKLIKQIDFLNNNPHVVLLGCWGIKISKDGSEIGLLDYPIKNLDINRYMLIENCFIHSAVIFNKKKAIELGGYSLNYPTAQDYDLWLRMGRSNIVHNLPERMVSYRINPEGMTNTRYEKQLKETMEMIKLNREYYPHYALGLFMWNARIFFPRKLREVISIQIRRIIS